MASASGSSDRGRDVGEGSEENLKNSIWARNVLAPISLNCIGAQCLFLLLLLFLSFSANLTRWEKVYQSFSLKLGVYLATIKRKLNFYKQ